VSVPLLIQKDPSCKCNEGSAWGRLFPLSDGTSVIRYPSLPNFSSAAASVNEKLTITSSAFCQFTGVATDEVAVNWTEFTTRKISSKWRPVEAGYVIMRAIVLSGLRTKTDRTVPGKPLAFLLDESKIPSSVAAVRSGSQNNGNLTSAPVAALMSSIHALWEVLSLHENPTSLTLRFVKSSSVLARQERQL
jgi:hypothetical protein